MRLALGIAPAPQAAHAQGVTLLDFGLALVDGNTGPYLNGNSLTTWHVPQAEVYGMGIALPGGTPSTATFVFKGTSNTWDFNGPCQ